MAITVRGTNHPALFGFSYEQTVDFYTPVLPMRLVLEQPTLDDPDSVHLFLRDRSRPVHHLLRTTAER